MECQILRWYSCTKQDVVYFEGGKANFDEKVFFYVLFNNSGQFLYISYITNSFKKVSKCCVAAFVEAPKILLLIPKVSRRKENQHTFVEIKKGRTTCILFAKLSQKDKIMAFRQLNMFTFQMCMKFFSSIRLHIKNCTKVEFETYF